MKSVRTELGYPGYRLRLHVFSYADTGTVSIVLLGSARDYDGIQAALEEGSMNWRDEPAALISHAVAQLDLPQAVYAPLRAPWEIPFAVMQVLESDPDLAKLPKRPLVYDYGDSDDDDDGPQFNGPEYDQV